jgi:wyosine [tRNA(Phe)-imidazoG37] synthetase (radical SAM superfamily)
LSLQEEIIKKNIGRNVNTSPPFPLKLKIDICGTCNQNCIFCPTAVQSGKHTNIDDKLCRILIRDGYDAGARELAFSATGEPLLNPKLEEYITFAKNIGYRYVFINTNGSLLNNTRIKSLLDSGLDSIKFSVNAGDAKSYHLIHGMDCFEQVIDNIKLFNKLRKDQLPRLFVSFISLKENIRQGKQLFSLIGKYIDDFIIQNANTRGGFNEIIKLEDSLLGNDSFSFKFPCSQLFDTAVVLAEGYLVICCQDFDKQTVIADLHKINITDAWNSDKFIAFRKKYLDKDLAGTLCNNCLFELNQKVEPLTLDMAHYTVDERKMADRTKRIYELRKLTENIS